MEAQAYRLPPLVPRISGTGCSYLPTPDTGLSQNGHGRRGVASNPANQAGRNLDAMAKNGQWPSFLPTPQQWDGQRGAESKETKKKRGAGGVNLAEAAKMWGTPNSHPRTFTPRKQTRPGDEKFQLANQVGGQLNADWVSILMGFPADWTIVEDGNAESQE